jgi:hypothetical protein
MGSALGAGPFFVARFFCCDACFADNGRLFDATLHALLQKLRVPMRLPDAELMTRNFTRRYPFSYHDHVDRGWSMTFNKTLNAILQSALLGVTVVGIVHAHDQQAQQTCMNAAVCLLAVRSGSSPTRRTGLRELRAMSNGGASCSGHIGRKRCG